MAVPARRGGTPRTQRQANSSAKGAADTQKGLCVCRGLPSVIFYASGGRGSPQKALLSRGIIHCLCAQSSTTFSTLQVIYFTTAKKQLARSQLPHNNFFLQKHSVITTLTTHLGPCPRINRQNESFVRKFSPPLCGQVFLPVLWPQTQRQYGSPFFRLQNPASP